MTACPVFAEIFLGHLPREPPGAPWGGALGNSQQKHVFASHSDLTGNPSVFLLVSVGSWKFLRFPEVSGRFGQLWVVLGSFGSLYKPVQKPVQTCTKPVYTYENLSKGRCSSRRSSAKTHAKPV